MGSNYKRINNNFFSSDIPKSERGSLGYDNPRENIDPRIITKVVIGKHLKVQKWYAPISNAYFVEWSGASMSFNTSVTFVTDAYFSGDVQFTNSSSVINGIVYFSYYLKSSSNGVFDVYSLPAGTIVNRVFVRVDTAFDGAVSLIAGDSTDDDGFFESTHVDLANVGTYCLIEKDHGVFLWDGSYSSVKPYFSADNLRITINNPASTTGSATLIFEIGRYQ